MAGKGPAPKPAAQRRRRNLDIVQTEMITQDDVIRGPELPETFEWHSRTEIWWDTWRNSAQSITFTDTDWDFLIDTALLHTKFWNGENVGAELRLRVSKFGATPEDRLRLRLQIENEPEQSKTFKLVSDQRKVRLLKAVGDNDQESAKAQ